MDFYDNNQFKIANLENTLDQTDKDIFRNDMHESLSEQAMGSFHNPEPFQQERSYLENSRSTIQYKIEERQFNPYKPF